jgi:hypothetical protein
MTFKTSLDVSTAVKIIDRVTANNQDTNDEVCLFI